MSCLNRRRRSGPFQGVTTWRLKPSTKEARSVAAWRRSTAARAHGAVPSSVDNVNCFVTWSNNSLQAFSAALDRSSPSFAAAKSPVDPKSTGSVSFAIRRLSSSNAVSHPTISCIASTKRRVSSATSFATLLLKSGPLKTPGACSLAQHTSVWRWAQALGSLQGFGRAIGVPNAAISDTTLCIILTAPACAAGAQYRAAKESFNATCPKRRPGAMRSRVVFSARSRSASKVVDSRVSVWRYRKQASSLVGFPAASHSAFAAVVLHALATAIQPPPKVGPVCRRAWSLLAMSIAGDVPWSAFTRSHFVITPVVRSAMPHLAMMSVRTDELAGSQMAGNAHRKQASGSAAAVVTAARIVSKVDGMVTSYAGGSTTWTVARAGSPTPKCAAWFVVPLRSRLAKAATVLRAAARSSLVVAELWCQSRLFGGDPSVTAQRTGTGNWKPDSTSTRTMQSCGRSCAAACATAAVARNGASFKNARRNRVRRPLPP
mmetsp:Transcript_4296/g.13730  ORF Transcript_4296/g.13730 Transcript_4296/m.13730 type:complete len:488 (-) Transcript_4296:190-1653(-)